MTNFTQQTDGLPTLDADGQPPESRIGKAEDVRNLVTLWIQNDNQGRSQKRALVDGLVQGNPPYQRSALVADGRADACNVNWRTAEAYEDTAVGAIYDLASEAPTFATVQLNGVDGDSASDWSRIVTEEFDRLQKSDASWDAIMQCSIRETVRFGAGPVVFPDSIDWHVRTIPFEYLQLPDDASSDVNRWEVAAIRDDMLPHQLYEYIRNDKAASSVGWDVAATRQAICNAAVDMGTSPGVAQSWEWVQQQLKQNSFNFSARSKVIQCCHVFAREFARTGEPRGKISHVIFVLNPSPGLAKSDKTVTSFLYRKDRCYDRWQQCIHPMYYSQGQRGKHYGVTGQGIKMFGAMAAQNRLLCNAYDKAFAPKIMFKPTTASGKQRGLPTRRGDYQILPDGWDMQQVANGSMIEDQIAMNREISGLVSANLSSYRQNLEAPKSGNPITAMEVQIRAADQSRMGKTQINRYYEQLDWLYEERYRRAARSGLTESDPGGIEALDFQRRCKDRGVPVQELLNICSVKATRVTGQGSQQLRKQALLELFPVISRLPEDGQEHLLRDLIASSAGQYMVDRYFPQPKVNRAIQDQLVGASLQVASMKEGVQAVFSPSQNPIIYAQTFIQAAATALGSVAQGNPDDLEHQMKVAAFLDMIGPATALHLQRMSSDPTRRDAVKVLDDQFKQIAQGNDQLKQRIAAGMKQRQQLQQQQAEVQSKAQIEAFKAKIMTDIKQQKAATDAQIKLRRANLDNSLKVQQAATDLRVKDATTAADIMRRNAETSVSLSHRQAEHDMNSMMAGLETEDED